MTKDFVTDREAWSTKADEGPEKDLSSDWQRGWVRITQAESPLTWARPKTRLFFSHHASSVFVFSRFNWKSKMLPFNVLIILFGFNRLCLVCFTAVSSAALTRHDNPSYLLSFVSLSQHVSAAFDHSLCILQLKSLSWSAPRNTFCNICSICKQTAAANNCGGLVFETPEILRNIALIFKLYNYLGKWPQMFHFYLCLMNREDTEKEMFPSTLGYKGFTHYC